MHGCSIVNGSRWLPLCVPKTLMDVNKRRLLYPPPYTQRFVLYNRPAGESHWHDMFLHLVETHGVLIIRVRKQIEGNVSLLLGQLDRHLLIGMAMGQGRTGYVYLPSCLRFYVQSPIPALLILISTNFDQDLCFL